MLKFCATPRYDSIFTEDGCLYTVGGDITCRCSGMNCNEHQNISVPSAKIGSLTRNVQTDVYETTKPALISTQTTTTTSYTGAKMTSTPNLPYHPLELWRRTSVNSGSSHLIVSINSVILYVMIQLI